MLIAQITDLHVRPRGLAAYRVVETNAMVERALIRLETCRPRPDVVLVTGDLTDCGLPEEYQLLRDMLARRLGIPAYLIPGNHDRREVLREVFSDWPGVTTDPEFVQFVVDHHPVRLIGLDTLVPGHGHGALCRTRLSFLEDALAHGGTKPTVVFMHHPPFVCGIGHMDAIRLLEGAGRFRDLIAAHPNVERVICGHHHRPIQVRYAGTIASIAPSVAHQVELELSEAADGALVLEPPAFQLHLYRPETGIVSHTAYVEDYPGPFPFVLDAAYPGKA